MPFFHMCRRSQNYLFSLFILTGMNKRTVILIASGLFGLAKVAYDRWDSKNKESENSGQRTFGNMRVSHEPGPGGTQMIRLRGSWEDLMSLTNPDKLSSKPPLPEDLNYDALPRYNCGCPHCGKMSLYGEGQWRYHEVSRTRGPWNNTTTFVVKCQNCHGFMKSTVDHDD